MFKAEGYSLMGAAFEVYNVLGFGMAEKIYQESLEVELEFRQIPFQAEATLGVLYKERSLRAVYRPDLLVFDKIVVELKAVSALTSEFEAQLFNYMRIGGIHVGYLLNFGSANSLEWKRFIL